MKKETKQIIAVLLVMVCLVWVMKMLDREETEPAQDSEELEFIQVESSPVTTYNPVIKVETASDDKTDAERLGVTEKELDKIEYVIQIAGWEYTRDDFVNIEVASEGENFIEYDVTMTDGTVHSPMINRTWVGK